MPQPRPGSRNARASRLSLGHYAPHPAIMLCDRPSTSPSRASGALLLPSTRTSTSQMAPPTAAGGKQQMRALHENAHALLQAEADAAAAAIEAAAEREAEAARRKEAMRHHESIQQQATATESTGSASRAGGRAAHTEKSSGALAVEKPSERLPKKWSEGLLEEKWREGLPEETRRGGHSVAGMRKPLEYACSPREAHSSPASPRENQRTSQCSSVDKSTSGQTWRREKHSVYMWAAESRCREAELVAIERDLQNFDQKLSQQTVRLPQQASKMPSRRQEAASWQYADAQQWLKETRAAADTERIKGRKEMIGASSRTTQEISGCGAPLVSGASILRLKRRA